jgi:hypothetical protein
MKISDLDDKEKLENYKVDLRPLKKFCDYVGIDRGYIVSAWSHGIWVKKDKTDSRVFPIYITDFSKILDLEIIK